MKALLLFLLVVVIILINASVSDSGIAEVLPNLNLQFMVTIFDIFWNGVNIWYSFIYYPYDAVFPIFSMKQGIKTWNKFSSLILTSKAVF